MISNSALSSLVSPLITTSEESATNREHDEIYPTIEYFRRMDEKYQKKMKSCCGFGANEENINIKSHTCVVTPVEKIQHSIYEWIYIPDILVFDTKYSNDVNEIMNSVNSFYDKGKKYRYAVTRERYIIFFIITVLPGSIGSGYIGSNSTVAWSLIGFSFILLFIMCLWLKRANDNYKWFKFNFEEFCRSQCEEFNKRQRIKYMEFFEFSKHSHTTEKTGRTSNDIEVTTTYNTYYRSYYFKVTVIETRQRL